MTGLLQIANKFITCLTAQAAFERQGWLLVERRFFFLDSFFFGLITASWTCCGKKG